jgi:hyperosmotically inducible protein
VAGPISATSLALRLPFGQSLIVSPKIIFYQRNESMKLASIFTLLALAAGGCVNSSGPIPDADNTEINERDQIGSAKTPLDQNENQGDIDITVSIRKQLTDSEMSVNAQNVKVITQDGNVTLRGPVTTADEKSRIETIARKVAGETNVVSQIEIAN